MASVATQMTGFGATITEQLWTASLRTGKLDQLTSGERATPGRRGPRTKSGSRFPPIERVDRRSGSSTSRHER